MLLNDQLFLFTGLTKYRYQILSMETIKIGVLSDTHLHTSKAQFNEIAAQCFQDASIIFHAGDLTNINVLEIFNDKEVHAVHGNMCDASSYNALPEKKVVTIGTHKIAITHGMQYPIKHGSFIEDQLLLDYHLLTIHLKV